MVKKTLQNSRNTSFEEKPFLEHLEDLRRMIIRILVVMSAATVCCFIFVPQILTLLKQPLFYTLNSINRVGTEHELLQSISPTGGFVVAMKIAVGAGIVVSLPISLYFVALFIFPGLTRIERRYIIQAFFFGGMLFVCGLLFCYLITLPLGIRFLWLFNERIGIRNLWIVERYVSFVIRVLLAFGLVFELPVVVLVLVKLGFVTHEKLRSARKYVVVGIFVAAAMFTPPDVFTQILMACPLILLYELCIWGARFIQPAKHTKIERLKNS